MEVKETMLRIRIDPKMRDQFKGLTAMNGTNMNAVLIDFIKSYIDKETSKK